MGSHLVVKFKSKVILLEMRAWSCCRSSARVKDLAGKRGLGKGDHC